MGAEGGIKIYRRDDLVGAFPDYEDMLYSIALSPYSHQLGGEHYITLYYGSNLIDYGPFVESMDELYNWDKQALESKKVKPERVREFISWLLANEEADWEVWT